MGRGEQQGIPGGRNGKSNGWEALLVGCVGGQADFLEQRALFGTLEKSSVFKTDEEMSGKDYDY